MGWLAEYSAASLTTDRFQGNPDQVRLLAAGLFGETGSILAELKKERREEDAYPRYRNKMQEEIGDFLWYFTRLASILHPELIAELDADLSTSEVAIIEPKIPDFLLLGALVGNLLSGILATGSLATKSQLVDIWRVLRQVAFLTGVSLDHAANANLKKTFSRWPLGQKFRPLFDDEFPEEEQLPRLLEIEFREKVFGNKRAVILRCNGLNFGDQLTDNIREPDGYRFHDIFHFAHMVYLGWSPVVRALLKCKRKSKPEVDEAQDGARAVIIEEGVSAIVYSRAKQLSFFDGIGQIDYDLLKSIGDFVEGYEIADVPLWQWERAIQEGYKVYRELRRNNGGKIIANMSERTLLFRP